jgi:two-component system NtrC family sensor kinase
LVCLCASVFSQKSLAQTPKEIGALVASVSEKLEKPIEDSIQLYKNAQLAVRLSKKVDDQQLLATSYKNLAKWHLENPSIDSTKYYLDKVVAIYTMQKDPIKLADTYLLYEEMYSSSTKFTEANQYAFKALGIYENNKNTSGTAESFLRLSELFLNKDDSKSAKEYARKSIILLTDTEEYEKLAKSYEYLADFEVRSDETEKALKNIDKSISILKEHNINSVQFLTSRNTRGNILKYMKRYDEAIAQYTANLEALKTMNDVRVEIASNGNIGHVYNLKGEYALALPYFFEAIALMKKSGKTINLWENYMHASHAYEKIGNFEKALEFQKLMAQEDETYYQSIIERQEDALQVKYETAKKEETIAEQQQEIDRQRKIQFLYVGMAILFATLLFFMYFSLKNIRKKRTELGLLNSQLNHKSVSLEETNDTLTNTITNLKDTQTQLIHAEKMASLGELTAGIAHEIQNPLNFVNNFSELSNELIDEMNEEIEKGDFEEAKFIAKDIKENLLKINHHGKRADAIVKGMLQHSRNNSAEKEPTDINKLADEYFRLAYHGLRAKDKSFNATLETDYDDSMGMIPVIPQDIGRVILNLITNAFYVVDEKKKSTINNYDPLVSVSTKKKKNRIIISVKDNGNGIPKHILDKIFQPFFTTKPTGQGTGLGLSMSYDIITKGHGGELKAETKEGEGTSFTIILPTKKIETWTE